MTDVLINHLSQIDTLYIFFQEHDIHDVTTYSLHPGVIRTEISRHFSDNYYGATWMFDKVLGVFIKSPRCGAQTTIYCAVDEACDNQSGLYYRQIFFFLLKIGVNSSSHRSLGVVHQLHEMTDDFRYPFPPFGEIPPISCEI